MNRMTMVLASAVLLAVAFGLGFGAARWLRDAPPAAGDAAGTAENEILYWVAPMDPNYRRDRPGKSPMGMNLVPVYADETGGGSDQPSVRIDPVVINNIGVRTEPVRRGDLNRVIESVARVVPNEYRLGHVHVRTEGWIEYLSVHTEGDRVKAGDVLFRFYAPALVSAQREYVRALDQGRELVIDATAERLLALGLQPAQVEMLRKTGRVHRLVDVRAPHAGYVMQLNVRHGMYVDPELMIMSIADLSSVWVEVDVFARQAGWVEAGQSTRMTLPAAPGREWRGTVDYVYPTLREESRTLRARLVFENPELVLRPGMYARVQIDADPRENVLLVPTQAVIRHPDGARVIVALGDGHFRPAEVIPGVESRGTIEIIDGLKAGEDVVVSAQFLIDSEASLDASLLRMIAPDRETDPAHDHNISGHDMEGHDMEGHDIDDHDMNAHSDGGHEHGH